MAKAEKADSNVETFTDIRNRRFKTLRHSKHDDKEKQQIFTIKKLETMNVWHFC